MDTSTQQPTKRLVDDKAVNFAIKLRARLYLIGLIFALFIVLISAIMVGVSFYQETKKENEKLGKT